MKISKTNNNGTYNISLTEKLSVYDASILHSELISAFEVSQAITLDWSKAESCDTAILQIILSAMKTAEKLEKDFTITEPNINISRFADNIGLDLKKLVNKN